MSHHCVPSPGDRDVDDHRAAWRAHVAAGRIGQSPSTTPEIILQHLRNEELFLGRPRSLNFAATVRGGIHRWR